MRRRRIAVRTQGPRQHRRRFPLFLAVLVMFAGATALMLSAYLYFDFRDSAALGKVDATNYEEGRRRQRPAIVTLVSNSKDDVLNLCVALSSLRNLADAHKHGSTSSSPAPVLIFHDGDLSNRQRAFLSNNCTTRDLSFPVVDFQSFPQGFNATSEQSNMSKRSKWGYQQMIRFWITRIWTHEILNDGQFTSVMT